MAYRNVSLALSSLLAAAGCSALNDPNALAQVGNDTSRVVVTQADKRAIFMFGAKNAYACPEPSPDVRADIDSTVKALLDVSAKLPDTTSATAKTELDATRK